MMFGRGDKEIQLWRLILRILVVEAEYRRRLDALLRTVEERVGMPVCALYLLDPSGQRLQLEHSRSALMPSTAEPTHIPFEETIEGGAAAITPTPPLELHPVTEYREERTFSSAMGTLYAVPLSVNEALVGALAVGPLPAQEAPRQIRRQLESMAFPLALVVYQAQQEEQLRQRLAAFAARSQAGQQLLGSTLELNRFVELLLDLALKATRTEAGFVAIVDPETHHLSVRAEVNMPEDFAAQVDLSPQTGLFDWSPATEGGALVLRDFEFAAQMGIRSILAVPLLEDDEPLGIFALVNFEARETFAEHSLALLATFAEQIKLVLHNARLFQRFATQYLETVKGLARSLDARHPHTRHHHSQVAAAAVAIARAMKLPNDEVEALHTASLIHDVGMAGIIEVAEGFQADFEHPTLGASLIEALPLHPTVAAAVATHHEWFDGWGFPQGLKGEEIPIAGRILAVAEFLVEMSLGDPVRPPWPREQLSEELERRRGTQFDPQVTDVALRLIREGRLPLPEGSFA
jgi:HD-GYP domain-containing protein (c-di-GMP phosphodiesterase class II)